MTKVDCEWMFGDAATGNVAKLNPFRWSGSVSFEIAVKDIRTEMSKGDRPIILKVPSGVLSAGQRFETCQLAIDFLEEKDPNKKTTNAAMGTVMEAMKLFDKTDKSTHDDIIKTLTPEVKNHLRNKAEASGKHKDALELLRFLGKDARTKDVAKGLLMKDETAQKEVEVMMKEANDKGLVPEYGFFVHLGVVFEVSVGVGFGTAQKMFFGVTRSGDGSLNITFDVSLLTEFTVDIISGATADVGLEVGVTWVRPEKGMALGLDGEIGVGLEPDVGLDFDVDFSNLDFKFAGVSITCLLNGAPDPIPIAVNGALILKEFGLPLVELPF